MFKVLIVDDESYIRKGLVNIIHWKKFDCEICGEASDGVEGLQKMKDLLPDIVFVDINMPEIDGLKMIREAKDIIPDCKFIILSGYREFSYMQEAIKLGAFDYLLKPSKIEEICEVVKRAVIELKFQKENEKELKKIKENFKNSIPLLKEKLLYDIINDIYINEDEIEGQLELYQLKINEFVIMTIQIDEDAKNNELYQKQLYQFGIINTVEELFSEELYVEKVVLNNKEVAFIIQPKESTNNYIDIVNKKANNIQQLIKSCFDFSVTISISTEGKGVKDLYKKMKECQECLSYTFYLGNSSIILYKDLKAFYKDNDLTELEKYDKLLIKSIRTGNEKNVKKLLEEIKKYISKNITQPEKIKNFYWSIIYSINHIRISLKSLEDSKTNIVKDITSLYRLIEESNNIYELHELLEDVAVSIVNRINKYNKQNINLILQKAIEYIHENYHLSITLNELAEHTYVSTYYLSRMFSKELGKNFVEYLNEVRIEKAKELLKDVSYKTYEVADLVGISDAHYFSKLFKKYVKMTPTEYRSSLS